MLVRIRHPTLRPARPTRTLANAVSEEAEEHLPQEVTDGGLWRSAFKFNVPD